MDRLIYSLNDKMADSYVNGVLLAILVNWLVYLSVNQAVVVRSITINLNLYVYTCLLLFCTKDY